MKGAIKKQKKHKDTEIYPWGKEIMQISFTGKNPCWISLSTEKKLTRDQLSGKSYVTQVTA